MNVQFLVIAKAPVPGRVKTRLCPPCTPTQAARVADAALSDTLAAVDATQALRRTLVLSGHYASRRCWSQARQRGNGLGERLAHAFADTVSSGMPSLLLGMDTPQITADLLRHTAGLLGGADAVLGPAEDGGWWTLALTDPRHAIALAGITMSTSDTYAATTDALARRGLVVATAPTLRDVDTAADAWAVADGCPETRFAATVRQCVPLPDRVRR